MWAGLTFDSMDHLMNETFSKIELFIIRTSSQVNRRSGYLMMFWSPAMLRMDINIACQRPVRLFLM